MKTKIDFIEGDTKSCLISMLIPMIAAMFLNMAYSLVDSLWIGNLLGETAYAALTGATPMILILNSIAIGATNGISILLSQAVGARDEKKADSILATSIVAAIIFSLCVTLIVEAALKPILIFMHTPDGTFDMAYNYLSIYILGYAAMYMYCYFTAVLRSYGDSIFQMVAMLICTVINAVLDPVLIRVFGFIGAAAATLISQNLCLMFMLVYLVRKKLFAVRISAFDVRLIKSFFAKGIPAAFQQSIPAVSTGFLTSLIGSFGITAIAAYGIAGKLETLLFYPPMALNMVLTVITGQCAGAERFDRAKDYLRLSLKYGCVLLTALSILIVIFAGQLSMLFVESEGASRIVEIYFIITGAGYILNVVTNCFLGELNGLGQPVKSLMCMILYYMIVRMPLAWYLTACGYRLTSIWAAVLISHIIAALTATFMGCRHLKIKLSQHSDMQSFT